MALGTPSVPTNGSGTSTAPSSPHSTGSITLTANTPGLIFVNVSRNPATTTAVGTTGLTVGTITSIGTVTYGTIASATRRLSAFWYPGSASPGTGTFGNTSALVYDSHGMPLEIFFQRPTDVTIEVEVTIASGPGWTNDYQAQIAQQIADYVNSIGIGNDVIYSKLFRPSYLPSPAGDTYDVSEIEVNGGTVNIDIEFDEIPVCDPETDVTFIVT